ncbi:MAG TPA: J domain-containing protein [Rhodospirillaceae bacterium]|nr:J domain-containing protein [Rhodospirillaceae bacterium]
MSGSSRKFWPGGAKEAPEAGRPCDHPGCAERGEFRAPKSRETLQDYWWFCLEHVRDYNSAWDYYAGLGAAEIETMLRFDTTWQRPTWPLGRMPGGRLRLDPERVRDPFGLFDEEFWQAPPAERAPPAPHLEAMRVMNLQEPLSLDLLRARYRELCKRHHPDANGGDKAAEERFKRIGQAYKTLMESLSS